MTKADGGYAICPYCESDQTEIMSLFGSQLLTLQYYCRTCRTPFECVRDERALAEARRVVEGDGMAEED